MTHALALVIAPPGTTRETAHDAVAAALAPHWRGTDYEHKDTGWWDYFQVGGRWIGAYDDYDPTSDVENIESPCTVCDGTGTRTDMVVEDGCNACRGRGTRVVWPTRWQKHGGDVIPAPVAIAHDTTPFTLVTPDGAVLHREHWDGQQWVGPPDHDDLVRAELARWPDHAVVVVDYHC